MIKLFLTFELSKIRKYLQTKKLAKVITGLLFGLVFLGVAIGIYSFFISGFRYISIAIEEEYRLPLALFIYEMFLIILSSVIVFSALISSLFALFRGQNDSWIIASPLYTIFPKVVFIRSVILSSWSLLVMFLPAILAFNKTYHLSFFGVIISTLAILSLLILLNAFTFLGLTLTSFSYLLVTRKWKKVRMSFKGFVTLLISLIGIKLTMLWLSFRDFDLVQLFKADNIDVTTTIQMISDHFSFLPTHLFAMLLLNLQIGNGLSATENAALLVVLAGVSVAVWWKVSHLFYPLWQKFQEGGVHRDPKSFIQRHSAPYYFTGSSTAVLFKKEALVSSRNLKGVIWFLFLLSIWMAQVGGNLILGHNITRHQADMTEKKALLQAFQFMIAIYFMCSFTLRFVFPSFSVERKTRWILGSAPLSFKKIFIGKYVFYTTLFVSLGLLMNYVTSSLLKLSFTYTLYVMSLFAVTVVGVVTIGLFLGALYPSRDTDDPEVISTTMPGLFFTALSLLYGSLSSWVLYQALLTGKNLFLVLFIVVTGLFTVLAFAKFSTFTKNVNL